MYRAIQDTNRLAEAYERSRQKRTEVHDNPQHENLPPLYAGETVWVDRKFGGQKL